MLSADNHVSERTLFEYFAGFLLCSWGSLLMQSCWRQTCLQKKKPVSPSPSGALVVWILSSCRFGHSCDSKPSWAGFARGVGELFPFPSERRGSASHPYPGLFTKLFCGTCTARSGVRVPSSSLHWRHLSFLGGSIASSHLALVGLEWSLHTRC